LQYVTYITVMIAVSSTVNSVNDDVTHYDVGIIIETY